MKRYTSNKKELLDIELLRQFIQRKLFKIEKSFSNEPNLFICYKGLPDPACGSGSFNYHTNVHVTYLDDLAIEFPVKLKLRNSWVEKYNREQEKLKELIEKFRATRSSKYYLEIKRFLENQKQELSKTLYRIRRVYKELRKELFGRATNITFVLGIMIRTHFRCFDDDENNNKLILKTRSIYYLSSNRLSNETRGKKLLY